MVGTCIEQMTEWVAGERMESHRREGLDDHTAEGDQVPYCQRDSGICFFSLQQLETVTVSECAFSQCENKIDLWPKNRGFPDSSVGKESACNAGDPSSIPGSGRSPGEGIGYPPQYSWASLVAQLIKNPPAMWETWVRSLGWENPLEKGKATHSNILAWRIPWTIQQRTGRDWATFTFMTKINLQKKGIQTSTQCARQ